ncbi:hypothetical protein FQN57_007091 [Myotisia sp. PD_48]|nr:hypothetical protein FQN57_007091 [Myotisia sp. PD_48]
MAAPDSAMLDKPLSSGINVIIVGIGVAGLSAAIECHRKGHSVAVYEKAKEVKSGDGITIGANGASVTMKWGDGKYHNMILPFQYQTNKAKVFDYTGFCFGEFDLTGYNEGRGYTLNRGALVSTMYKYAESIGIKVQFNSNVTDYWETEKEAGIVVNNEKVEADCVICAEGIHSLGRALITGQEMEIQETGFSASRGYLASSLLAEDSNLNQIFHDIKNEDCIYGWLGPEVHFSMTPKTQEKEVFWPKERNQETPSTKDVEIIEHIVKCMEDWPVLGQLEPIIRKVTEAKFVSERLAIRKPLKTWLSPRGRMIVVGDAAHAALPSSGQGGTQAIEDAAVLAICLELAGKQDVPLALAVLEKIRYQRSQIVQQGGVAVLNFVMKHDDFEGLRKDPASVKPPHPAWILDHDCQEYTYRQFHLVADALRNNKNYVPHNIPTDGIYRMEYNSSNNNVVNN